ncbi:hypothetical protein K505DRAFT_363875 [Melanomma pulvis-pyrius CBS 109.77]|uniref:Uncharacterized protein n=1 Tax=Melanomma pulvis-pyrius CBS 109.77 TaxID=1314802 RepID=A0A6A6X573_9PLEO|nr:hypothetical protein K505DRAFT_363875 [Melanomma pulvis-pyrius CBS 109.77]
MSLKIQAAALLDAFTTTVSAHRYVPSIVTAGQAMTKVESGGTVEHPWTTSLDLAKVGDVTTATVDGLSVFKIDHDGLDGTEWATTKLIASNNS